MAAPFPSLLIRADDFVPEGAFARSQAEFLSPDLDLVADLGRLLEEKNAGVVAHFYMDPELQGVLTACPWPHIRISDSLLMADSAIAMAEAGIQNIVVLGVDFMSENVRAILDAAGHGDVTVYRVAEGPIGCSLAEAATGDAYAAYLAEAGQTANALHVVYINTSLITKAQAQARVPTITCTSSNVVKTILQAATQIDDVEIFYGPDTYMGQNLEELFGGLADMDEGAVRAVHASHTPDTIRALLPRLHHFQQGVCIVHHMFGADVTRRVREDYPEAMVTAHLEVPGEMFALGMEASRKGRGVVGSTSNILNFISERVHAAGTRSPHDATDGEGNGDGETRATRLSFVLGTEAGMITSIVRKVQGQLRAQRAAGGPEVEVEVIFPVASDAIAQTGDDDLAVVPGVLAGEGCTVAGGCATCPFMKMNSLDATLDLLKRLGTEGTEGTSDDNELRAYRPKEYAELIDGQSAAELGGESILHMRHFQREGALSDELVG
ncbi:MAG: quinolinate synthase NadA, partial [Deltaproteobacteria bacterium]|nr:quinolinate synthase NadA [Deltaproteobacteria bacterium]